MCEVLEVSRSGYYKWINKKLSDPTTTELRRTEIKELIVRIFHESYGTYGAVRIHKELLGSGIKVSERTVGRYMNSLGLTASPNSPYTITTDSNHNHPIFENLLRQNFKANKPNQVWVSDITYIWTTEGWIYLAIILDLYSRKIVGWHVADHMQKELPLLALQMAISSRKPGKDLIIHSDRGSQYASHDYREKLEEIDALGSMSRKGNPYDNACAETFFATIKKELVYRRKYKKKAEAISSINWYIVSFYNEKRRHSHNNYLSPNQFEGGEPEISDTNLIPYLLAG